MHCESKFDVNNDVSFSLNDYETGLNNNILICGSPGSGKTTIVHHNIIKNMQDHSHVIVDIKGRMRDCIPEYKALGYRVFNLDFVNFTHSQTIDIFKHLKNDTDYYTFASTLYGEVTSKDPYWDESGKNGTDFSITFVGKNARPGYKNLRSTLKFINKMKVGCDGFEMEDILSFCQGNPHMEELEEKYLAFNVEAKNTSACIKNTITSRLKKYMNEDLLDIFVEDNGNAIDFDAFANEKCIFIISLKDYDTSLHKIVGMILTMFEQRLYELADQSENGRLKYPVQFWLDDMGTYFVQDLHALITTGRSRGIAYTLMLQSINQLENVYGDKAMTILEACDRLLYLGSNSVQTKSYLSSICGIREGAISNMKKGHVLFYQRGEEAEIIKMMDFHKVDQESVLWYVPHQNYYIEKEEVKKEKYKIPNFKERLKKSKEGLPLSKDDLGYLYSHSNDLDDYCMWKYAALDGRSLDKKLKFVYIWWDLIPKEYFDEQGRFLLKMNKNSLQNILDRMKER